MLQQYFRAKEEHPGVLLAMRVGDFYEFYGEDAEAAAQALEITLTGRRVTRTDVTNDWGLQIRWVVTRDGKQVATVPARAEKSYEYPDTAPGTYEIVLQSWKYVDYRKTPAGEFVNSKFIDISNKVTYKV